MPTDIIEDFIAFAYATSGDKRKAADICPICGTTLEENENGDLCCPECGE